MGVLKLIIFSVINLQEELQTFLVNLFIVHIEDNCQEVVVEFQLMHLHLAPVFQLLYQVHRSQVLVLLVDLDYQIFDKIELLNSDIFQLLLGEQLSKELLKLVQLIRLTDALLASNQLVYPPIVAFFRIIIVFHFVPDTLQSSNQNLDFVAEFVDKSKKIEDFSNNAILVGFAFIVSNSQNHHLVYVLLS